MILPDILLAVNTASAATSLAINLMEAAHKYNRLAAQASAEDRDISEEELAELKAESDAITVRAVSVFTPTEG